MALFRLGPSFDAVTLVRGEGVYLRPAEMRDFDEWASLRERSRAFLAAWEPIWPADDLTRSAFRRRIRLHGEEMSRDEAFPFLVFRDDDTLVGGLTVGQIRRGVAQTATLGYWMGHAFAGRGYMSRAVRSAAGFVFGTLRLHRLEAACLPHNEPSMRLLQSVGFHKEGYARAYLRIDGRWQDHVLFALLDSDPVPSPHRRLG